MGDEKRMVSTGLMSGRIGDERAMHEAASAVVGMFEEASRAAAPEDAPTKPYGVEGIDTEQNLSITDDPVLIAVRDVSERHGLSLDEAAQGFVSVRAHVATDEQAAIVLDAVAETWMSADERTRATMIFRSFVDEMVATSKNVHAAKHRRVLIPNTPQRELVDARGNVIPLKRGQGKTPTARIASPSTIVVEGGSKSVPLPPAQEYDGKVDPELEAQINAGKTAYHLDTLEALENEAKEADAAVDALTSDRSDVTMTTRIAEEPLVTVDQHPERVLRGAPSMRNPATHVLMTMGLAAMVAGLGGPNPARAEAPPPRPATRGQGKAPRTIRTRHRVDQGRPSSRPGACGSAPCRTLDTCLCDCRKCRAGCPRKG